MLNTAAVTTERGSRAASDGFGLLFASANTANEATAVEWLEWCEDARNMRPTTLVSYAGTIGALLAWCVRRPFAELGRKDLEAFTQRTRRGREPSPATRRREVATLRAFWQWQIDAGKLDPPNPCALLVGPKVPSRNPKPISDQTWLELWHGVTLESERVFLGFGFYCGLRRAELATIESRQATPTHLRDFIRKGGGDHTMPWLEVVAVYDEFLPHLLPEGAACFGNYVQTLRKARTDELLLPWGPDPQALNRRLTRICQRVGTEPVTPHQLRHSACTNLLRAGVPLHLVASLMNHSSVTITMGYVQAGGGELAEWRKRLR